MSFASVLAVVIFSTQSWVYILTLVSPVSVVFWFSTQCWASMMTLQCDGLLTQTPPELGHQPSCSLISCCLIPSYFLKLPVRVPASRLGHILVHTSTYNIFSSIEELS